MNGDVLLITNRGGIYGTGHHKRMCLLKERLRQTGITAEVAFGDLANVANLPPVVVLDSRDDEFPRAALQHKTQHKAKDHFFIAVDNRGYGRSQGDIAWDTLPHMHMNDTELQTSLENCILDPVIVNAGASPQTSKIRQMELKYIEALEEPVELIQYASSLRTSLDSAEFHKQLIRAKRVATYYGQTFFEALFLGKEIYLYDISDYHKELADWFAKRWNREPDLARVFDGGGLNRLAALIASHV